MFDVRFLLLLALVAGCAQPVATKPAVAPAEPAAAAEETSHDPQVIAAAIAKLSPEDQVLAKQQRLCPVALEGGHESPLGSMGVPVKVTLEGRSVFLCCAGCTDFATESPAKMLALVDKLLAEKQAPDAKAATEPATTEPTTESTPSDTASPAPAAAEPAAPPQ